MVEFMGHNTYRWVKYCPWHFKYKKDKIPAFFLEPKLAWDSSCPKRILVRSAANPFGGGAARYALKE
jgi:hypothetical protein